MIGIVCHEAGSAEIISEYLKKNKSKVLLCSNSLVRSVFKKKNIETDIVSLKECVNRSKYLITGTSNTNKELQAIKFCKQMNKKTITFLDHWSNYQTRFLLNKELIFPYEVNVFDNHAFNKFSALYPFVRLKQKKNLYLSQFKKNILKFKNKFKTHQKNILILTTPISSKAFKLFNNRYYYGFDEFAYIEKILDKLNKTKYKNYKVYLKIHPSEKISTYNKFIKKKKLPLIILKESNFHKFLFSMKMIIGFNSMLMYLVSEATNISVLSYIPKGKIKNVLPSSKIKSLSSFLYER
jgi:hypothetical protein